MSIRNNALKITILCAFLHCVTGNLIGIYADWSSVLGYLFLPYTFISGWAEFAGWGIATLILELGSFAIMIAVFYPIGLMLQKDTSSNKQDSD